MLSQRGLSVVLDIDGAGSHGERWLGLRTAFPKEMRRGLSDPELTDAIRSVSTLDTGFIFCSPRAR